MMRVAGCFAPADEAITAAAKEDEATIERIAGEVREMLAAYPIPGWAPA